MLLCLFPPLQHLSLIQYIKGNHVICAAPHVIEAHLRKIGSAGLEVSQGNPRPAGEEVLD